MAVVPSPAAWRRRRSGGPAGFGGTMSAMPLLVAAALALVGLAVVAVALWRDDDVDAPGPGAPDWDPLPLPGDLARIDFGLRVPGYDPATVDVTFDALVAAYADLLAEADPATRDRARRRVEQRLARAVAPDGASGGPAPTSTGSSAAATPREGHPAEVVDAPGAAASEAPRPSALGGPATPTGANPDGTRAALQTEAALARIRQTPRS
jgi:hypothetical protein